VVRGALEKLLAGRSLTRDATRTLFGAIMDGRLTAAQIGGVLVALRQKGEVADELIGAALAMRERATPVPWAGGPLVDTCGTGGDGAGTFNISTAAAFVAAADGVPVAKHGNRSVSSRCGSADVLEALGVRIDLGPAGVARCLDLASIGFMFAPRYHGAMRHVAAPRRELGVRTVFNMLGPLTNPAGACRQVVGTYSRRAAALVAEALVGLGCEHALIVHGAGGLDELSLAGDNQVLEVRDGTVRASSLAPEAAGLERCPTPPAGGDAAGNARLMERVLAGEPGPVLDTVLLNAAATLLVAGRVPAIAAGVDAARRLVASGAATATLEALRRVSQAVDNDGSGGESEA
jgi:anthranilate phosphoribosyltransferase